METELATDSVAQTWNRPFEAPQSVPDRADVVVIGGGIVGVSTAWFLARQGVDVVLCEKGHIACEQSSRNWGWVRQQGRDTRELPMMIESMNIWRSLEEDIGEDVGFSQTGCLFMARDQKKMDDYADWIETAKDFELDTRMVSGRELDTFVDRASSKWMGAMYTASDARAEPQTAAPAIARAASREGATILPACAVRGIETHAGRVGTVVTEHGAIRTSTVLCAAGAWTSMFCGSLDIIVPQLKVRGTVTRTAPADAIVEACLWEERLGIRRRQDGGYTVAHGSYLDHGLTPSTLRFAFKFIPALMKEITVLRLRVGRDFIDELTTPRRWSLDNRSPFEETRVLDPEPNPRVLRQVRRNLDEIFPQLANTPIVESWAGMVETTPDVIPIIGEDERMPGFHIATGLSGHGFGIGPGVGKACAGMLTGNDSGIDLEPFRLSRFFDGTPIRPQSSM